MIYYLDTFYLLYDFLNGIYDYFRTVVINNDSSKMKPFRERKNLSVSKSTYLNIKLSGGSETDLMLAAGVPIKSGFISSRIEIKF